MADHVVTISEKNLSLPPPPPYTETNEKSTHPTSVTVDSLQALTSLKKILGDTKQFILAREPLGVRLLDASSSPEERTLLVMTLLKNFRNNSSSTTTTNENERFVTGVTRFCAASGAMPYLQMSAEETEDGQNKRLVTIFDKVGGILGTIVFGDDLTPPSSTTVMEIRDRKGRPTFRIVELKLNGGGGPGGDDEENRSDILPTYNFIQVTDTMWAIVGSMWKNGGDDDEDKVNLKLSASSFLESNVEAKALILAGAHLLYQEKISKNSALPGEQQGEVTILGFWDQQFGKFLYWFCWCFAIFWFIMVALVAFKVIKIA